MMKKRLKPKRDSFLQKQLEQEARKKKKGLGIQGFNKRSARVIVRLRKLNEVRNKINKQFVPKKRDCCQKTLVSDDFTN